jgi:RimJ/RimL family protein N-acetyltransferase
LQVVTPAGRILEAARPADVREIVALESRDDMSAYVCSWDAARHLRNLKDPNWRYFVVRHTAGGIAGFAILSDLLSPNRWLVLERIALEHRGSGLGTDVLRGVLSVAFGEAGAHRLALDVYEDNLRARRVYEYLGFRQEGILREAVWRGDRYVSLVVMAMLASEWAQGAAK